MNSTIQVSVVVASHRPQYIEHLAESLGGQVTGPVRVEVIIVCDYDPGTLPQRYRSIQWLFYPDRSISAKRNQGIRAAKGDIVAFIDDDCTPLGGWVHNAVVFLDNHPEMAGVEGKTTIDTNTLGRGRPSTEYKRLEQQGYRTNNIFYRRNILSKAGMFDERFTVQREDLDLAFSILTLGYTIGYDSSIGVIHAHRSGEQWDLLKNCVNRRFDPLLFRKHPRLYRRYCRSPLTPSIGCILLAHLITAVVFFLCSITDFLTVMILDAAVVLLAAFRKRSGIRSSGIVQFAREYFSFFISPGVLIGALIAGSIRFRKLLIF